MDEGLAVLGVRRGEDIVKKLARDFPINFRLWSGFSSLSCA